MHRVFVISGMALGLALLPAVALGQQQQQRQAPPPAPQAQAQPGKPLKDLVVGTYTLLIDDGVKADGTHVPNFGPNPEGMLILTADGHYSVQMMRTINRPKFVSNNRTTGTADENKAAVAGTNSAFGTYTVDPADKSITFSIQASLLPNQEGGRQKRMITAATDEVLTYNNPMPGNREFQHAEVMWKKLK
jgi:hypothetical protein